MHKILLEIIDQVFHNNIFFGFFVFLFFRLDKFRPIIYQFNGLILRVCVLRVRGT